MDNQTTTTQGDPVAKIPAEIRNFLDNLLQEAEMESLDPQMHEDMIMQLYKRLDKYITTTLVDSLPPEHIDEFIKMNEESKSQEEIEQFLKDKLPNSQEVFTKAFVEFRDMYLGNTDNQQVSQKEANPLT